MKSEDWSGTVNNLNHENIGKRNTKPVPKMKKKKKRKEESEPNQDF